MTPVEMAELKRLVDKLITDHINMQQAFISTVTRREDVDIEYGVRRAGTDSVR